MSRTYHAKISDIAIQPPTDTAAPNVTQRHGRALSGAKRTSNATVSTSSATATSQRAQKAATVTAVLRPRPAPAATGPSRATATAPRTSTHTALDRLIETA